jgi:O-antigen ligase
VDPVNLPKLCSLIFLSFISAGLAFSQRDFLRNNNYRAVLIIAALFILQLTLVLLVDSRNFAIKFYGIPSRNTGFIAYLSLVFLLLASLRSASNLLIRRYLGALITVGLILGIYGILQSKGYDFYEFDNSYGSNVFGSFGNPNFQSAFMGITAATSLTLAIFGSFKIVTKVTFGLISVLAIYVVSISSQQGFLNFSAGFAAGFIIFLFKKNHLVLGWTFIGIFISSVVTILLGILNQGPLAEVIYKSSLQARGFYWRGAINMILNHPFFGVGMDGFGDWYRRSRTAAIASVNASTIVADTAHSIPLDIGASGGLPLLLLYLAFVGLALSSILRVIKRKSEFDVLFAALVSAWVAYQAQSLISINQLGIGVWGWTLTGFLIGYEINFRESSQFQIQKNSRKSHLAVQKISALAVVLTFVFTGAGIAIAFPPYIAANKFYKALQSGDADVIQPSAYLQPLDRSRFLYVASILSQNKLDERSIDVLRDASRIYPDTFEIWQRWSINPAAAPADIGHAEAELKRLDPYNPDLK